MPIGLTDILVALGSFPLMEDVSLLGGLRAVADISERDAIPAPYRKAGMFVWTQNEGTLWWLNGGLTNADWNQFSAGGGGINGDLQSSEGATQVIGFYGRPLTAGTPANGDAYVWSDGDSSFVLTQTGGAGRDVFAFNPLVTEDDRTFNDIIACLTAASNYSIASGRSVEVQLFDHGVVSSGSNWAFERFTFRGFGGDPTDIKSLTFGEAVTINSTRLRFRDVAVTSTSSTAVWAVNADSTLELDGYSSLSTGTASFADVGVAHLHLVTRDRSVLAPASAYLITGTGGSGRVTWYQNDSSWGNPGSQAIVDPNLEVVWYRNGVDEGSAVPPLTQIFGSFTPNIEPTVRQVIPLRIQFPITSDVNAGNPPFFDASEQIDVVPDAPGWNINSFIQPFNDSRSSLIKFLQNDSGNDVNIVHEDLLSVADERIVTRSGATEVLPGNGGAGILAYSGASLRWYWYALGSAGGGAETGVTKVNVTYSTVDDTPEIGYTYVIQGGNGTMIGVELHAYAGTNFSYAQYKILALFKINADGVPSQENFQFIGTPFEGTPTWDIYFDYATTPNLRVMLVGEGADTTDWRIRGEITETNMSGGGGGGA
jgi:hypothetical protein